MKFATRALHTASAIVQLVRVSKCACSGFRRISSPQAANLPARTRSRAAPWLRSINRSRWDGPEMRGAWTEAAQEVVFLA